MGIENFALNSGFKIKAEEKRIVDRNKLWFVKNRRCPFGLFMSLRNVRELKRAPK